MQNRYRRLLLAVIVLSWTVADGAERALAATFSESPSPTAGSSPNDITSGPDGNLWFTEASPGPNGNKIGRMSPSGAVTEFDITPHTPDSGPANITRGPDGALWFTEFFGNKIGRIATDGTITETIIATTISLPHCITKQPDNKL